MRRLACLMISSTFPAPLLVLQKFDQHNSHLEEFYWLRQCEGHTESLLVGSGTSTQLVPLEKQKAMLMFAMRQGILTSTANASWPNKENKGIWEKLWMSKYAQKKCCQIWKHSKSEHCQGLHWWFKTKWRVGAAFYAEYPNNSPKQAFFHLGIYSTVFQAEVLAISGSG